MGVHDIIAQTPFQALPKGIAVLTRGRSSDTLRIQQCPNAEVVGAHVRRVGLRQDTVGPVSRRSVGRRRIV
jgi:hypothetical protein